VRQVAILLLVLKFALALGMVEKPSRGINEIAKGGITVGPVLVIGSNLLVE